MTLSFPFLPAVRRSLRSLALCCGALYAALFLAGCGNSSSSKYVSPPPPYAAVPTISPAGGTFTTPQVISLTDNSAGATIYYEMGAATAFSVYSSPIMLTTSGTVTVTAYAGGANFSPSATSSQTYTLQLAATPPAPMQTPAPTFSPAGGTFAAAQTVTLADSVAGAAIYYTTNGQPATPASMPYTAPISLSATTTLNAIAVAAGDTASADASATYTINIPSGPNYSYRNVPIVGGGYIDGVLFHPTAKGLMYAYSDVGGAYRWNDVPGGDAQWVPLTDFVGTYGSEYQSGIRSLAMDPSDATRLYLALSTISETGETDFLLSSADMGNTFKAFQLPVSSTLETVGHFAGQRLSVDPANGSHIYFGSYQNGLYETTDQGATWHTVPGFGVTGATGFPLVPNPYAADDPGVGIIFEDFLSRSGTAANGNTKTIYFGVSDPGVNPATGQSTGLAGLYSTNDGGATFTAVAGQPTGYFLNGGTIDSENRYLYLSYGRTATLTAYQQSSPCIMACDSVDPRGINDGQIWRYTLPTPADPAGVWTNITPPLLAGLSSAAYVANPYGFSGVYLDPSHPDTLMVSTSGASGGTAQNDVLRSLDDGKTWVDFESTAQYDGSLSPWIDFGQSSPNRGVEINHVAVDPFNPDHILYGTDLTLWASTDATAVDAGAVPGSTDVSPGGVTHWAIGAVGVEGNTVYALASPPSGPPLLSAVDVVGGFTHTDLTSPQLPQTEPRYAAGQTVDFAYQSALKGSSFLAARAGSTPFQIVPAANQLVGFSTDGGLTWNPNSTLPPYVAFGGGSIAVAADGSVVVWAPIDTGFRASISYTTDMGATWTASQGIQGGAGNGSPGVVIADRVNPKKFYAYYGRGFYVSSDGGRSFSAQPQFPIGAVAVGGIFASPAAEGDLWFTSKESGVYHSTDGGVTVQQPADLEGSATALGFGMPAPGQTYPTLYLLGSLSGDATCAGPNADPSVWFTTPTTCVYRSVDAGKTWVHVNDFAHQYGTPTVIVGDPRVFGRYYLGTRGRGIIQADSPQ